jgi:tyrosine-specific transport protein
MSFIKALSVFLGTVIGVGIFGLPFVALRAGFFVAVLYFLFMTFFAISVHFLYGEIALGTKKLYRLPGYVGEYLGEKWKKITFFIITVGLMGALLAYLIVGGQFLNSLFASYFGGSPALYTLLFFVLGAYLVFRGIKSISGVELSLFIVLFIILVIFFIKAAPIVNINYLKTLDLKFLPLPYGVVLFSLWGLAIVPEIKEMFAGSRVNPSKVGTNLKKVIFLGIVISAIIYLFFIFIVLGVSGPNTSKEALSGFAQTVGGNIIKLGFVFGVITCFTSFITLALTLKKVFWYDFGFSKNFAWFFTCFLPLILFLLGVREFIEIIGFTGAVALGSEGIITVFLYRGFLKKKFSQKMNPTFYLLIGVFALGIIFEIGYFILDKII